MINLIIKIGNLAFGAKQMVNNMTSENFVFWLQGLFELGDPKELNEKQTELIRRHLALVFIHEIDPSQGNEEHQAKLNEAHTPPASTSEKKPSKVSVNHVGSGHNKLYRC